MFKRVFLTTLVSLLVLGHFSILTPCHAQTFVAEGSDTGAGVGARQNAMGGVGVASTEDAYVIFYNPAAMNVNSTADLAVDRQLNAELRLVSYLGATLALPTENLTGFKAAVGFAFYPRVHARASGAFSENDFESIFLRYLLPDLDGTFDGDLESKTKVYRVALNVQPSSNDFWAIGFNFDYIDCKTNFCGTTATSNGFTIASTEARATSFGLSVLLKPIPDLRIGASFTDLGSDLTSDVTTTDDLGTRTEHHELSFPIKTLIGAAYKVSNNFLISAEYEVFKGDYGSDALDLQMARVGAEYNYSDALALRLGAMIPIKFQSEQTDDLDFDIPLVPTAGIGWNWRNWQADLALYLNPVQSAHEHAPALYSNFSLTVNF